ncbi:MAG: divalent metal cation transporter [Verrucomicrobiota bacterium]
MSDRESELLDEAQSKGLLGKAAIYSKLSGPGWLQSAITLGGGSLGGALFLGVIGGFEMMWVQPFAMLMGVFLLAAISYVTLSIKETPFQALRTQINPVLAWGWLLASQLANMIWVLPQYSLSYAALTDNLFPGLFETSKGDDMTKYGISFVILAMMLAVNFMGSGKGRGYRIYENTLKVLVGIVVISFFGVVIRLASSIDWGAIATGFIPNFSLIWKPAASYEALIASLPDPEARSYWTEQVLGAQRDRMIAASAAAVGINMTFLMPWALRSRGWGKKHRGLASFDLFTGMMVPFVLATGCVVITAASQFHGKPFEGLMTETGGKLVVHEDSPKYGDWTKSIDARNKALGELQVSDAERKLAGMLIPRDTAQLAAALEGLFGSSIVSQKVFGLGVLAMGISTISILMLISGFVACEVAGQTRDGPAFKIGTALASTGVLWPLLWGGDSKAYLAVVTSTFGYVLFPIAFLAFVFMINSRKVLGDQVPTGARRLAWNIPLIIALLITGLAAGWTGWNKKLSIGEASYPLGQWLIIGFSILVVIGFFLAKGRRTNS